MSDIGGFLGGFHPFSGSIKEVLENFLASTGKTCVNMTQNGHADVDGNHF